MDFLRRFCLPCLPFLQPDSSSHLLLTFPPTHQKAEPSIAWDHQNSATISSNATSLQETVSSSSLSRSDSLPISVDPTEENISIPSVHRSSEEVLEPHEVRYSHGFLLFDVTADMAKPPSSAEALKPDHEHLLHSLTYTEFSSAEVTSFISDATSSSVYQSFNDELRHSYQVEDSEAEREKHSSQPLHRDSHSLTVQVSAEKMVERYGLSDAFRVSTVPSVYQGLKAQNRHSQKLEASAYRSLKPQNRHSQKLEASGSRESGQTARRSGGGVRKKENVEEEAEVRHGNSIRVLQSQIRDQIKRQLKGIRSQMKKKKTRAKKMQKQQQQQPPQPP